MLCLDDLKFHCRTCLVKFEKDGEDPSKFVDISKYSDIHKLMCLCLEIENELESLQMMPSLCRLCFEKWQDFSGHYQLFVKSDEKLRNILKKEAADWEAIEKAEPNKVFIETATVNNEFEVEKYETASPFYHDSNSNKSDLQQTERINTSEDCADQNKYVRATAPSSPKSDYFCDENFEVEDAEDEEVLPAKSKRTRRKNKSLAGASVFKIKRKYTKKESNDDKKVIYRCEPCKKYFYEIRRYEGHIKKVHEGIKRAFQCKECDKAYKFYRNLTEHIGEVHNGKQQEVQKCETCNKIFKNKLTLSNHMKSLHPNEGEEIVNSRRIICDQCGFLAANQLSLTAHIKNKHTEAEEFKCEQCPRVYKNQYYLKSHIRNHHSDVQIKPFKCTACETAFTRRTDLNKHERTHLTYTERMKCDFEGCDVRFLNMDSKRRHTRLVHLKMKEHVCDICGEAFGIKATLRHHRYIHTGEKPYKCKVCGQGFRQHTAMKTHAKTHFNKSGTTVKQQTSAESESLSKINVNLENNLNIFYK